MPHAVSTCLCSCLLALALMGSGCDESRDTGAPASGPAGEVVELEGEVRAERSGKTRTLQTGAEVYGDDRVRTAAGSSVVIVLEHNGARWSLGPEQDQRVRESLAWKAEKQSGPGMAGATRDDTVTAGRNVENETASTAGTLAQGPADPGAALDEEVAATEAEPTPPPPAPAAERKSSKRPSPEGKRSRPRRSALEKSADSKATLDGLEGGAEARGPGGLGLRGSGRSGGGTGGGSVGLGEIGTAGKGRGGGAGSGSGSLRAEKRSGPTVRPGSITVEPKTALDSIIARRFVRRYLGQLRYCYEQQLRKDPKAEGQVVLILRLSTDATVEDSSARGEGAIKPVAGCIAARARRWQFSKPKSPAVIRIPLRFELGK